MIKEALSGFDRYSDTDFIDRASTAVKSLTGNPDFLNPEPPLEDIQAAIDAFYEAFLTVKQGAGKQETAIKNQRRHELEALLKRLVVYVNLTAAGDVIKLDSTGLEISKDPSAVGILPAPADFHQFGQFAEGLELRQDARVAAGKIQNRCVVRFGRCGCLGRAHAFHLLNQKAGSVHSVRRKFQYSKASRTAVVIAADT